MGLRIFLIQYCGKPVPTDYYPVLHALANDRGGIAVRCWCAFRHDQIDAWHDCADAVTGESDDDGSVAIAPVRTTHRPLRLRAARFHRLRSGSVLTVPSDDQTPLVRHVDCAI